jgi:hypothetical protein
MNGLFILLEALLDSIVVLSKPFPEDSLLGTAGS